MRPILAVLATACLSLVARTTEACPVYDWTYVWSGGAVLARLNDPGPGPIRRVVGLPAFPSVYVHIGIVRGTPGMPTFTRMDGTPVPFRWVESVDANESLIRVDLDVEAGAILVSSTHGQRPDVFLVSSYIVPKTRSVERQDQRGQSLLRVDSDAALVRIELPDGSSDLFPTWWVPLPEFGPFLVVAIYPDRREEVIYRQGPLQKSDVPWAWALLGLLLVIGRRALAPMPAP